MRLVVWWAWIDEFPGVSMNRTARNLLTALVVGIAINMILSGLIPLLDIKLPGINIIRGVGVAIAIAYMLLNNQKK